MEYVNFRCVEQQPLAVTNASSSVQFKTASAGTQPDIMIVNYGTKGCQVRLSGGLVTAIATSNAAGTDQIYVPAGAIMAFSKSNATWVSAICDGTDTTNLAIHIGAGE